METKTTASKKDFTPTRIRTIHADQTAYKRQNFAGFYAFVIVLLIVAVWAGVTIMQNLG